MDSPLIRAKAKDSVDELDNLTAYFEPDARNEVAAYVLGTLRGVQEILIKATESGIEPVAAYSTFVTKFEEYWITPTA